MRFEHETVRLSSGHLSYRVAGSGRPIVSLHSAGGIRITDPLTRLAQNHRVFLPVVPGYDGTPLPDGDLSMHRLGTIMAEFVDTAVAGSCDVMGQSFGGWLALWLAVERPDLVEQLVLLCPAGFRRGGRGGLPQDPAELRTKLYAYPERLPPEERSSEQLAANRSVPSRYHRDVPFDAELAERLPGIEARTLILHGTRDEVIPAACATFLKGRIPHSHLTYVYDAAHGIDVDQPERMLRITTAFLERGAGFLVPQSAKDQADAPRRGPARERVSRSTS
jgi:pimeloyl-ACP methyl ester carboxylesterase